MGKRQKPFRVREILLIQMMTGHLKKYSASLKIRESHIKSRLLGVLYFSYHIGKDKDQKIKIVSTLGIVQDVGALSQCRCRYASFPCQWVATGNIHESKNAHTM